MLTELLKFVIKKRKQILGAKPGTDPPVVKSWVRNFILPHKYHAPHFYQIFCHTLVN